MKGKVVVITGGTSGIGQVAAEALATMGARIILVARDRGRAEHTLKRLQKANAVKHSVYYADLSLLAETKRVGREIAMAEARIDVLLNNAGAMFASRSVTSEGLELTFATNHLSYFVLAQVLKVRLLAAGRARIINTASDAHRIAQLDFADLQLASGYSGFKAYGRSKLCNILFTRELARQLDGSRITVNALHPGFVATRFGDHNRGVVASLFRFGKHFAMSPQKGAETLIYLASSPEVANVTGEYFFKSVVKSPARQAQDDVAARRLWAESAKLCGFLELSAAN